ncbi:MAG: hypothetical protein PHW22_04180 [Bacilli bacterium]|nr:hypothetical protein [Bacilli bacterium]
MYCYHCGKKIDETKVKSDPTTIAKVEEAKADTSVSYICPRCGHLIHSNPTEADVKSLAAAAHAEMQRGRNSFASGMGYSLIGIICLLIAIIFLRLAHKPGLNYALQVESSEFIVSMILFVVCTILIIIGIVLVTKGVLQQRKYKVLLDSIQNKTFYQ